MGTYYLIRHGETKANQGGIIQGHMDVPLAEIGKKEAELVGKALSVIRLDAVYSSDLSRARETAQAIVRYQKCKLILDSRLRELHCGEMQGLTLAASRERFPEFFQAFQRDPLRTKRPGGESLLDLYERSCRALEEIYRNYPEGNVAIVSHGGVIKCLMAYAAGQEVDPASPVVANASISVISRDDKGWHVLKVNDVEHLRPVMEAEELEESAPS
ncbi:MAG TPA: histidine phosphatase family protein [Firmicutes bacterium]|nr:histidine phosphatase family protein [Candidatus Fermentithermobacillaceae bacterium]